MHRIFREKTFIFLRELRSECFIVRDNKRRLIYLLNNIGNGKRLARAGHAQKRLLSHTFFNAFYQAFYSFRLIPRRFKL